MKTMMKTKKIHAIVPMLLVLGMLFTLSACGSGGGAESSPYSGTWNATTASMSGLDLSVEDLFDEGFTVDLKANGKCEVNFDGEKGSGTWSEENGTITISDGDMDLTGTIDETTMVLDLGDGITLTLTK